MTRVELTPGAADQVARLRAHYEGLERIEASRKLLKALSDAGMKIGRTPGAGLPAPRPYPDLAVPGLSWLKLGRYWFAYTREETPKSAGVFYETADIPGQV